jgi:hypothetical protein
MKVTTDAEAHEVMVTGVQIVGSAMLEHGPTTPAMIISGLMAICVQMGAESILRDSFSAAVETIDAIIAQKESETATKQ